MAFFNLWDSFFRATTVQKVEFGRNCLSTIRDDISCNRFHECMPTYLIAQNKKRDIEDDEGGENKSDKKRLRDKDNKDNRFKELGDMVKNGQAVQEWIMPGNKYKAIFSKEVISSTPPFNNSGLITCNKWHVRGFCYEKCDRKGSHKKFDSVTHKTSYDT